MSSTDYPHFLLKPKTSPEIFPIVIKVFRGDEGPPSIRSYNCRSPDIYLAPSAIHIVSQGETDWKIWDPLTPLHLDIDGEFCIPAPCFSKGIQLVYSDDQHEEQIRIASVELQTDRADPRLYGLLVHRLQYILLVRISIVF